MRKQEESTAYHAKSKASSNSLYHTVGTIALNRMALNLKIFLRMRQREVKFTFPHPYSLFERPQNERHNGLLREYLPKGISITRYSEEEILHFADEINARLRRILGYWTADEVFDEFLDKVCAIKGWA